MVTVPAADGEILRSSLFSGLALALWLGSGVRRATLVSTLARVGRAMTNLPPFSCLPSGGSRGF
jgi:hypothetical protein